MAHHLFQTNQSRLEEDQCRKICGSWRDPNWERNLFGNKIQLLFKVCSYLMIKNHFRIINRPFLKKNNFNLPKLNLLFYCPAYLVKSITVYNRHFHLLQTFSQVNIIQTISRIWKRTPKHAWVKSWRLLSNKNFKAWYLTHLVVVVVNSFIYLPSFGQLHSWFILNRSFLFRMTPPPPEM